MVDSLDEKVAGGKLIRVNGKVRRSHSRYNLNIGMNTIALFKQSRSSYGESFILVNGEELSEEASFCPLIIVFPSMGVEPQATDPATLHYSPLVEDGSLSALKHRAGIWT